MFLHLGFKKSDIVSIFSLNQVKSGTIFDNFLIADDVKAAEEFGEESWGVTKVKPIDLNVFKTCQMLHNSGIL